MRPAVSESRIYRVCCATLPVIEIEFHVEAQSSLRKRYSAIFAPLREIRVRLTE